jgi:hypothetical protein
MSTLRLPGTRSAWGLYLPVSPLASFAFALDVLFALLLSVSALAVVCLLWHRKSPRHEFVLDLMTAESAEEKLTPFPGTKTHASPRARVA